MGHMGGTQALTRPCDLIRSHTGKYTPVWVAMYRSGIIYGHLHAHVLDHVNFLGAHGYVNAHVDGCVCRQNYGREPQGPSHTRETGSDPKPDPHNCEPSRVSLGYMKGHTPL